MSASDALAVAIDLPLVEALVAEGVDAALAAAAGAGVVGLAAGAGAAVEVDIADVDEVSFDLRLCLDFAVDEVSVDCMAVA